MSTRAEAFKRVRELVTDDPYSWNSAWAEGATPWDAGGSQPPLREILQSGEVHFPTSGRALVPGCGSGYDAIYIASALGLETLAIDVSSIAVSNASKNLPEGVKVRFEEHDFFAFKVSESEKFDLVYDYTFFVAIPPSRRSEWGAQMNALIKPGGHLITLVYPIDEEPETPVGPPWFVRPEHYHGPLGDGWIKVVDRLPQTSSTMHIGRERLVVWKRL
ncbi:S-adenosyl-L-methionine-dependent methyltransferase [Mycena amicta]|nr:S-adenosyl-L-methionine-dependent methyltransferase [Mycena amicta]